MSAGLVRCVPLGLTALRALLAPVILVLAWRWPEPLAFAACLIAAFLSDLFDGIVARRLGIATPALRRLDSIADSLFYVAATVVAWHLHRDVLVRYGLALVALLAVEVVRYVFDFMKFRREASYHMWSSKLWGLALFAGFYALLVYGDGDWPVALAIGVGLVADLEGLAISVVLREWRSDVPSVVHAWRWRRKTVAA